MNMNNILMCACSLSIGVFLGVTISLKCIFPYIASKLVDVLGDKLKKELSKQEVSVKDVSNFAAKVNAARERVTV